ncbi:MAG: DUF1501 domain-containing protein [Planctomycetota bacterium]
MLSLQLPERSGCVLRRRELMRIGGLTLPGLSLPQLLSLRSASGSAALQQSVSEGRSCVFIFLFGGPSQLDMWDMKPQASREIRGDFRPIATSAADIQLCEHLPHLAGVMHHVCLVRSMHHRMPVHGPACSEIYSGRAYPLPPITDQARREDWPSLSSLVTRFGPAGNSLPSAIVLPWHSQFQGQQLRIAGQTGGRMGEQFNPFLLSAGLESGEFDASELQTESPAASTRLMHRARLLNQLEQRSSAADVPADSAVRRLQEYQQTAFAMLETGRIGRAVDLTQESPATLDRYGKSVFARSLLAARRLVEAGIPLITVNWYDDSFHDKVSPHWDQHNHIFPSLRDRMLPVFDQSLSAFLEDLQQRGLLSNTLVAATGEFGRTPRVGQFTQNAMTEASGRDHWPHAFTVLLAGGGIRGGQVFGATDHHAAHVRDNPVTPADLTATILEHLGIDTTRQYWDPFQQQRQVLTQGRAIPVERG